MIKTINRPITFWKLLNGSNKSFHEVQIPIIQRDYAQGREGKEYLRKSFLTNLKDALDGNLQKGENLKLDFIYGANENDRFNPLDGQQRLTTLWLLHWFIALKSGHLADASKTLKKFTYETRISSREFCECLCKPNFSKYDKGSVVDFIKSQTWFYNEWKHDPTIDSMLRMLKGTEVSDSKGNDIIDGFEELFRETTVEQFEGYYQKLISDDAPIVFYNLPLDEFGLSDDLYVKMNARGKQLTSFENLKADLIGYIEEQVREELEPDCKWHELLDPKDCISNKIDGAWTDIFWKNKSIGIQVPQDDGSTLLKMDHHIDEIYFEFINRLFWNELFIAKEGENYILDIGKDEESSTVENNNRNYFYLNDSQNKNNNYAKISYEGIDLYEYCLGTIPYKFFKKLEIILDRYDAKLEDLLHCPWDEGFSFIPKYEKKTVKNSQISKNNKEKDEGSHEENIEFKDNHEESILQVRTLGQTERIVFFAICKYLVDGEVDEGSLKSWMRVVWNLVSGEDESGNPIIRSTKAVRNAIEFIDKLKSHDVYNSLLDTQVTDDNFGMVCAEEKVKAQQIINAPDGKWEENLLDAERYGFFRGAIKFLYRDENSKVKWSDFDTKLKKSKELFLSSNVKNSETCLNCGNDADLLKKLFSFFETEHFEHIYWSHKTFNNNALSWRYYLLNDKLSLPIHKLLTGADKNNRSDWSNYNIKDEENKVKKVLYLLSETELLDFVIKNIPNSWIRNDYHGHFAIYPSARGVFLDAEERDKFLLNNQNIKLYSDSTKAVSDHGKFLYSNEAYFEYNEEHFVWDDYYERNNKIFILDSNGIKLDEKNGIDALPTESLPSRLDELIESYKNQ